MCSIIKFHQKFYEIVRQAVKTNHWENLNFLTGLIESKSYSINGTTFVDVILHPNALPSIMEWPSSPRFKIAGKFVLHPSEWNMTSTKVVPLIEYDFDSISPVKKIKFSR